MSNVLSIVSITTSVFTLLAYLFQEYKDLFTIYWFADYDVVYVPIVSEDTLMSTEFVEKYEKEFHRKLGICEFKNQWVGSLNTIYYYQSSCGYEKNSDDSPLSSLFISVNEYKYFSRKIITHKGKKAGRKLRKSIRRSI